MVLLGDFLYELKASDLTIIVKHNNLTVLSGEANEILEDEKIKEYRGDPVEKLEGLGRCWVVHIGYDS